MTLLIHPGFHKTGTSWLQGQLFTDRRAFNKMFGHDAIYDLIVRPHDLDYDDGAVRREIDSLRSAPGSGIVDVITSETLGDNPFNGRRESMTIANRLVRATGPAKVLFTVREPTSIIRSAYLQYVKRGGRMKFGELVAYRGEPGYRHFVVDQVQPGKLVEYYGNIYGHENVLVLPQEILFKQRQNFLQALMDFVGVSAPPPDLAASATAATGKSPSAAGAFMLRMASHFMRTPINTDPIIRAEPLGNLLLALGYRWTLGGQAADRALKAEVSQLVKGRYLADNAYLQRYCPFDLANLGYEVAR